MTLGKTKARKAINALMGAVKATSTAKAELLKLANEFPDLRGRLHEIVIDYLSDRTDSGSPYGPGGALRMVLRLLDPNAPHDENDRFGDE